MVLPQTIQGLIDLFHGVRLGHGHYRVHCGKVKHLSDFSIGADDEASIAVSLPSQPPRSRLQFLLHPFRERRCALGAALGQTLKPWLNTRLKSQRPQVHLVSPSEKFIRKYHLRRIACQADALTGSGLFLRKISHFDRLLTTNGMASLAPKYLSARPDYVKVLIEFSHSCRSNDSSVTLLSFRAAARNLSWTWSFRASPICPV